MLIILFICIGLGTMSIRFIYFGSHHFFKEDTIWKISLSGRFNVTKDASVISSPRPKAGQFYKLISQRFYHPGLKILSANRLKPGYINAKATRTDTTELIIDYHIQLSQTPVIQLNGKTALATQQREKYLQSDANIDLSLPALLNLNEYIQADITNKDDLLHKIFLHSQKLLKETNSRYDDLYHTIKYNKTTTLGRAKLMVALCRMNNIPARLVNGFVLKKGDLDKPNYWVQVYDEEKRWQAYDPEKGFEKTVPNHYVVFDYDNTTELFSIENGKSLSVKYSLAEDSDILNIASIKQKQNIFDIFNLQKLDFEVRQALGLLLILPFCVLMSAFIRHVLGFYPYGTFTATLLALAMVYAEISITLVVAGIVIFLALIGRAILPKSLLRAPRLSLIFTFVVMSMVLSISIMSHYSVNPGGNIILLPTIILVTIVDRFYSYMDDVSTHAALIRLGVTVLVALLCLPLLQFENLRIFTLAYPEVHFLTAAFVLAFSSYRGKKLTDFNYLKLFGENKIKKKSQSKPT